MLSHIRIGAIDDELDGVVFREDNSEVGLLATYHQFRILWRWDSRRQRKVFRSSKVIDGRLCRVIHLRGDYHRAHSLHVVGDGEAEDEHHHNGHAKEDQHRALVAQDVLGFLDDK